MKNFNIFNLFRKDSEETSTTVNTYNNIGGDFMKTTKNLFSIF